LEEVMKMRLSKNPKERYSPSEQELFELLGSEFVSSDDLIKKWYGASDNVPFHARSTINAFIRNLDRKMRHNNEPIAIEKTRRSGPHPIKVRLRRVA
jgi:hypothetical protein